MITWRRKVLLGLLAFVLTFALLRDASVLWRFLPYPVSCNGSEPVWIDRLIARAKALAYPGFQLSFVASDGQRVDCAAGWAGAGPFSGRLRLNHVMRYASLSKVFTATVAAQLIQEDRLQLDDTLVGALGLIGPFVDDRVRAITVGQLLSHTAGFDRKITPDPTFHEAPWCFYDPSKLEKIRLDFSPGSQFAYANVGYCLLGKVLSQIENASLDRIFEKRLFEPAGVKGIQALQRGQLIHNESAHQFDSEESLQDLLAFNYEAMLATGAWAGTASDLASVLKQFFWQNCNDMISCRVQNTLLDVDATCPVDRWRGCHGLGFYKFQEADAKAMYWRDGSLPGVSAFAGVFDDGSLVVFLANSRQTNWIPASDQLGSDFYDFGRNLVAIDSPRNQ